MSEITVINRPESVWCLKFSPVTPKNTETLLTVGSWDGTLSFWNLKGQG
jgi:WD40 repeat protein